MNGAETYKLNTKMELWEMEDTVNEIGENDRQPKLVKTVWTNTGFVNTGANTRPNSDVEYATSTQKIRLRKQEVSNPKLDMYFIDTSNNKYEIIDFYPDYYNNNFWEFRTKIIRE